MKKSVFFFGLLATTLCLAACGSKNFNMTFEEALEIANHSALQDILSENDNFEQSFLLAGNYDSDWMNVDASISSDSKQSLVNKNSESSTKFGANINISWDSIKIDWALDIKLLSDIIYLNLSSLELTWSEDLSFVAMMTAWIKGQWFSIPMTGLSDMPNTFSILKDSKELNTKTKEIVINEWFEVYNWKFTQFNWYNAWKFSLDNEKLNDLVKEYYDSINTGLDEEGLAEVPELNIQSFEWYLVITWKDKVTTVIENIEIAEDDIAVRANWYAGENFELNMFEGEEDLISIVAEKKWSKYGISANFANAVLLNWTVSARLSKSSIELKFDAVLTVKAEAQWESDTVIPFNGSWKYNAISEFTVVAPESAQDLTELLWSYLWWMWLWDDYAYDYDDELEYADDDSSIELEDVEWMVAEPVENVEWESVGSEKNVEVTENVEVAE